MPQRLMQKSKSTSELDRMEAVEKDLQYAGEEHDGYHDDFEFVHDDFQLSSGVRRATVGAVPNLEARA